jgi:glycerol kinase
MKAHNLENAMQYVLSIDQGTSSSRAIIFDLLGRKIATSQRPITQYYPQPGWVDHDAGQIWQTVEQVVEQVITESGIREASIVAVGITNQRETTVVWDRVTGQPLAPAMVWQSRQSADYVRQIADRGMTARYQEITGLVPDAYFSATKLACLLGLDPELKRIAEAGDALFGTIDSWLMWNLTGGAIHRTDVTNAARTMLFDINSLKWSEELLSDLGIPAVMLPEVCASADHFGDISQPSPLAGLPIAGVAGDQHAALFGQACFEVGQAKNTYGTGSFALMNVGANPSSSDHKLLSTIAWEIEDVVTYALEGAIFVTGSAVQWLRDGLGILESASDIEALASTVDSSDGVVFVPALAGLGAPHWDAGARGMLIGITRGTSAAHIARATLEGIAFQVDDVLSAMCEDSGKPLNELRVDGGAAENNLLLQMQADVSGVPVIRPKELETTALGAAYLAGLTTGVWSDKSEIAELWQVDQRFEPAYDRSAIEQQRLRWQDAVARSKGWA